MQRLHLLATSLLATTCTFTAAQSPGASLTPNTPNQQSLLTLSPPPVNSEPSTYTLTNPKADGTNSFKFKFPQKDIKALDLHSNTTNLDAEMKPEQLAQLTAPNPHDPLLAHDSPTCYTLRVYGFTPQNLKSPHPHAATETSCTPASTSHAKPLELHAQPMSK